MGQGPCGRVGTEKGTRGESSIDPMTGQGPHGRAETPQQGREMRTRQETKQWGPLGRVGTEEGTRGESGGDTIAGQGPLSSMGR